MLTIVRGSDSLHLVEERYLDSCIYRYEDILYNCETGWADMSKALTACREQAASYKDISTNQIEMIGNLQGVLTIYEERNRRLKYIGGGIGVVGLAIGIFIAK